MNGLKIALIILLILGICLYIFIFLVSPRYERLYPGTVLVLLTLFLCSVIFGSVCNEETIYKYKAELKDGTIDYATNCYKHDTKKICEFPSGDEMVVVDYWLIENKVD